MDAPISWLDYGIPICLTIILVCVIVAVLYGLYHWIVQRRRSKIAIRSCNILDSQHQNFALPKTILHYVNSSNENGVVWYRLIQTCKFFYASNAVLPVFWVSNTGEKQLLTLSNGKYFKVNDESKLKNWKLWILGGVKLEKVKSATLNFLISSRIYRCDIRVLQLISQTLKYQDFLILTGSKSIQIFKCKDSNIWHLKGTQVTLDLILNEMPKAKNVKINDVHKFINIHTAKKLYNLPSFTNLDTLKLIDISDALDVDMFLKFMMKQMISTYRFHLSSIVPDEYQDSFLLTMNSFQNTSQSTKYLELLKVKQENEILVKYDFRDQLYEF